MANAFAMDRLQPSLFDRLNDELATAVIQLEQDRRALDALLDTNQRIALSTLLADERLERRPQNADSLSSLAALTEEARSILDRIISIEVSRRQQVHRSTILTIRELRNLVLRDLQSLLNTTCAEADLHEAGDSLARYPLVQRSVLNYGVPALAGRVRTTDDVLDLAQEIVRSIEHYEPRVRQVSVRVADNNSGPGQTPSSPLELIIEGELWGYPVAEHLRVYTVLDLDAGHAEVAATDRLI